MTPLLATLILAIFILVFGVTMIFISNRLPRLMGVHPSTDPVRLMPYECGIPGTETKETKISVKFYLTAILFILFDIEVIFMYPWAITYVDAIRSGTGLFLLGAMGLFILLFVVGLVWEIKSKALEWD